jgi:hypothetical protein
MLSDQARTPAGWTPEHTTAFLLLCAAGVDGFQDAELGRIVPLLERLGMVQAHALLVASEAFDHYRAHMREDTVEDALLAYAISLKRALPAERLPHVLAALHDVSRVDQKITEGEVLVLGLLEEVWRE